MRRLSRVFGRMSRLLNRITGGKPGTSLCWRWAKAYGVSCLPCRAVGWLLRDPLHCLKEILDNGESK